MRLGVIRLALFVSLLSGFALAQNNKTAEEVLQQAIAAIGGLEKLQSVKTLYTEAVNTRQEIGQSYLPAFNEDFARVPRETFITETWVDFTTGRRYWLRKLDNTQYANLVTPTWGANLVGERRNPLGATVVDLYQDRNRHMTFPGPLFTALERKGQLQRLPDQKFQDRLHYVLGLPDANRTWRLFIEQSSGLLAKIETDQSAPVRGKVALEYRYSNWQAINGVKLPLRTEGLNTQNGASHWTIEDQWVEVNKPEGAWFSAHAEMMKAGVERVARDREALKAPPAPLKYDKLGEGVYYIRGTIGSLAVAMGEYTFIVEAPTGEARSKQIIALTKELFPNKQLVAVGVTHWHYDTVAGLRAYVAEGVRIAASSTAKDFFEKFLTANTHDDALSKSKSKPQFLWIEGERSLSQGGRTIQAVDIPNAHAAGMLGLFIAGEGILFIGDIFPTNEPAYAQAILDTIQKHKLDVKQIVGSRGGPTTLQQLQQAAAVRPIN
ncbi:MAG: MBL fold metallo-hydrolase [Acidobacteria bacterium]|nr:MBL fold metallo-hydrolase [Acidobacteriota bacterium]MBI3424633.1 MBL fold metallo-hydrolase [Acidobacteriota bacterium]